MNVTLDHATHTYWDELGRQYASVTTILGAEDKFDGPEVAKNVIENPQSKYYRWTVEECLVYWEASADMGTQLHKLIEEWIKHGKEPHPKDPNYASFSHFKKGRWKGKLLAETVLWDTPLRLAGTSDIIEDRPKEDLIWDVKTCRTIDADKLFKYSMQLEIYGRMRHAMTGKPTRSGGIIWYEEFMDNPDAKPQVLKPLPCTEPVNELLDKWAKALEVAKNFLTNETTTKESQHAENR